MEIEVTPEGVEIWHYTPEESLASRDEKVRRHSRFQTASEFIAAYHRRELVDGDDDVDYLVHVLGIGQS